MPPKAIRPDERPSRLNLLFASDRHKQASSTPSHPETPSGQGGSKFNTKRALRNTNKVLDVLKIVGGASSLLGPLKTTCDALKIVVTIAEVSMRVWYLGDMLIRLHHQGMVKNNEDLKDLPAKLQRQLNFIQGKTDALADPRFRPSGKAIHGLVDALETYTTFVAILESGSHQTQTQGLGFSSRQARLTQAQRQGSYSKVSPSDDVG
jgi:hypothetical protein